MAQDVFKINSGANIPYSVGVVFLSSTGVDIYSNTKVVDISINSIQNKYDASYWSPIGHNPNVPLYITNI